jgi:hypothetical protein
VPGVHPRGFQRERRRRQLAPSAVAWPASVDPDGAVTLELVENLLEVVEIRQLAERGIERAGGVAIEQRRDRKVSRGRAPARV